MIVLDTVGTRIRKIRELRGMLQKDVAKRAGLNVMLLRRYEAGDRDPKADQIEKIAQALDVEPSIFCLPKCEFIPSLLYNLMAQAGDFKIEQIGDSFYIGVHGSEYVNSKWNQTLAVAKSQKDAMSKEAFQNWLMVCNDAEIELDHLHRPGG